MSNVLFSRIGRPAPLRTALELLRLRVAALRVQVQSDAARNEGGKNQDEEGLRAHAATAKKSPRVAGVERLGAPVAVGVPLAAGARGAPSKLVAGLCARIAPADWLSEAANGSPAHSNRDTALEQLAMPRFNRAL